MKPKIILVKHFDHAILAGLAILLLVTLYTSFLSKEEKIAKITEDIDRYDSIIKRAMLREEGPTEPPRDYFAELRARLEHPALLSPYAHNPFFPEPDIIMTKTPLLLPVGQSREYVLQRTRLTDILQTDKTVIDVRFEYYDDPELEERFSKVTIIPLPLEQARPSREVKLRLGDDADRTYYWRIFVQETTVSPPPNSPVNVAFMPEAPHEADGVRTRPARVLITFWSDDPETPSQYVGITTGARISRKLADAPDVDYVRLNEIPLVPPATQEQVDEIARRFYPPQAAPGEGAETPGYDTGRGAGGVIVPRAAPTIGPRGREGARMTEQTGEIALQLGAYIFLDETVDENESYVYKIETVSAAEDAPAVECDHPFVTPVPIIVPSLVDFAVLSISATSATVVVTRPDPESGGAISWEFRLVPGMKIGGLVTIKRTREELAISPGHLYKHVDFSTDNVLVDMLPTQRQLIYIVDLDPKTGRFVYKVKTVRDPRILYLTPRGALRLREKAGTAESGGRIERRERRSIEIEGPGIMPPSAGRYPGRTRPGSR